MLSLLFRTFPQPFRVWWPPPTFMVALLSLPHLWWSPPPLLRAHYPLHSTSSTCSYQNKLTLQLPPFSTSNHRQPSLPVFAAATGATTTTKKWRVCNGRFSHLKFNNNEDTSHPCSCSFTSDVGNLQSRHGYSTPCSRKPPADLSNHVYVVFILCLSFEV